MSFWPEAGVVIMSEALLETFVEGILDEPDAASTVQDLTIQLPAPFSLQTLRQCLGAAIFITDLILLLPPDTIPDLLDDFRFPSLELFKTDLPHGHLVRFLSFHPFLTDLCLGACGGNSGEHCPLRPLRIRGTTAIECPVDCVSGVAHPKLLRLSAHIQRPSLYTSTMLKSLKIPLPSLLALTLDVFPDDYDILQSVVFAAPRIERLKLLERTRAQRRGVHACRAWNDAKTWSGYLARLEMLGDFALRTSAALLRSPTLGNERKTIVRWASRVTRPTSMTNGRAHPRLTSLRVWYRTSQPGGGILTYWSKSTGIWDNIARVLDPMPDTPF